MGSNPFEGLFGGPPVGPSPAAPSPSPTSNPFLNLFGGGPSPSPSSSPLALPPVLASALHTLPPPPPPNLSLDPSVTNPFSTVLSPLINSELLRREFYKASGLSTELVGRIAAANLPLPEKTAKQVGAATEAVGQKGVDLLSTPLSWLMPGLGALAESAPGRVLPLVLRGGETAATAAFTGMTVGATIEALDRARATANVEGWGSPEVVKELTSAGVDVALLPLLVKHLAAGKNSPAALGEAIKELRTPRGRAESQLGGGLGGSGKKVDVGVLEPGAGAPGLPGAPAPPKLEVPPGFEGLVGEAGEAGGAPSPLAPARPGSASTQFKPGGPPGPGRRPSSFGPPRAASFELEGPPLEPPEPLPARVPLNEPTARALDVLPPEQREGAITAARELARPKGLAEGIRTLPTDTLPEGPLRNAAEDLATSLAKEPSGLPTGPDLARRIPAELRPYTDEIAELAVGLRNSVEAGRMEVEGARGRYAGIAKSLPDGVWRTEVMPGYDAIFQTHKGEIVGAGTAIEGKTSMIAGGKLLDSPVSARPLYEFMRKNYTPDDVVTSAGELARRRAIRHYEGDAGPLSSAIDEAIRSSTSGEGLVGGPRLGPPRDLGPLPPPGLGGGLPGEPPAGPPLAVEGAPGGPVAARAGGPPAAPPPAGAAGGGSAGAPPSALPGGVALPEGPPPPGGPPPGFSSLPKYAGSYNLWRAKSASLAQTLLDVYHGQKELIDEQRRTSLSIEEQDALGKALKLTPEKIASTRPGTAKPAEWHRAATYALEQSDSTLQEIARAHVADPTELSASALKEALVGHTRLFRAISGVRAEAGRALGTLAHLPSKGSELGARATIIDDIASRYGPEGTAAIAKLIASIDPRDIAARTKFSEKLLSPPSVGSMLYEAWLSGIFSGPPTQIANGLSNSLGVPLKIMETELKAISGSARQLAEKLGGRPAGEVTRHGEAIVQILSLKRGIREGLTAALQAWRTEAPVFGAVDKLTGEGSAGLPHTHAIPGRIGKAIRAPLRGLLAGDELFKGILYRMEANSLAYRRAIDAGARSPKAIFSHMAETLSDLPPEIKSSAVDEALYRTFNSEPGEFTKDAIRLREKYAAYGTKFLVPVIRTAVNVLDFGLERTLHPAKPYTLGKALYDYSKGKTSGLALDAQVAKTATAAVIALSVMDLVSDGRISGGGPTDPAKRRTLEKSGWQPYSVKIGSTWYSYSRLEPLGVSLGLVADFYDMKGGDIEEIPGQLLATLRKNILSKTWLSPLSNLFQAFSDEERYGEAWAIRTLSSVIPNIVNYTGRALDPTQREPSSVKEGILARIPGQTSKVLPALDIFGQPKKVEGTWLERFASPIYRTSAAGDPAAQLLIDNGLALDAPSRHVEITSLPKDFRRELSQDEIYLVRRARGIERRGRLQPFLSDSHFLSLPQEQRRKVLEKALSDASADVTKRLRSLLLQRKPIRLSDLTIFSGPPGLGEE